MRTRPAWADSRRRPTLQRHGHLIPRSVPDTCEGPSDQSEQQDSAVIGFADEFGVFHVRSIAGPNRWVVTCPETRSQIPGE